MKGIWGNRGAAVVEFAILFLLLMVIVFGIIEFGFIWLQSHYIANAAREGARVAARLEDPKNYRIPVDKAVTDYLKGLPLYKGEVVKSCCEGSNDIIKVAIEDEKIEAGPGLNLDAVKVTVTVDTTEVWKPILWDLLRLINPDAKDVSAISSFAVFASENCKIVPPVS